LALAACERQRSCLNRLQPAIRCCQLSEFSYMNFRASALRILGLSPTSLPSFRAKYHSRKNRTNG
jgi:hypothetical protein